MVKSYGLKGGVASCNLTWNEAMLKAWRKLPIACNSKENCYAYYEFAHFYGTHYIASIGVGTDIQVSSSVLYIVVGGAVVVASLLHHYLSYF